MRQMILINNLLDSIIKSGNFDTDEEYRKWLTLEVGFSDEDISELEQEECFPKPSKYYKTNDKK